MMSATPKQPKLVKTSDSGAVRWLTLSSPKARNALSLQMMGAIEDGLHLAFQDPAIRVVILDAEGHVFSAGHDLKEMGNHTGTKEERQARQTQILTACANMMRAIPEGPKPVIACVEGVATAAGCQLVAFCDLAICSDEARFATPGVNVGLFCTTPLVGIGRKIHRKHALEMALTGEFVSAEDAYRMGLVNRVVAKSNLREEVEAFAQNIATKSAQSIAIGKRAFYKQVDMSLDEALEYTLQVMIDGSQTDDAHEGSKAFFEKRAPEWSKE